jgi:uncharacterized membrane protein YfcA
MRKTAVVSWFDVALLLLAGVGAGLTGSVAGLASLVSYPVLLAIGIAPVSANVTNTVALVFSSLGSVAASTEELTGQGPRIRRLGLAAVGGGIAGGVLLLAAPAESFRYAVPWLIGGAAAVILLPRKPRPVGSDPGRSVALFISTALVGVYGGYFGAAAGVLLIAALLAMTPESLARSNAAKNVLIGSANAVAAIAFACFGPVHWLAVVPLALGLFVGGAIGPSIVRRAPARPLRVFIALAGLALALGLGWQAYL